MPSGSESKRKRGRVGLDAADARVHEVAHNADTVTLLHGGDETDEKEGERGGFYNSHNGRHACAARPRACTAPR